LILGMASPTEGHFAMSLREHETAERRRIRRKHKPERQEHDLEHRDKVLTFRQWCQVNGFSKATGHRLIKAGEGPSILQLSPRRIGIKESANAAWQASRAR
jgi:predicted DNA-binding transcriptional regulator AlpA